MTTKLAEAAPLTGSAESSLQIGVPRTMVWAAVGVGAILGVAYTLSPLSIYAGKLGGVHGTTYGNCG